MLQCDTELSSEGKSLTRFLLILAGLKDFLLLELDALEYIKPAIEFFEKPLSDLYLVIVLCQVILSLLSIDHLVQRAFILTTGFFGALLSACSGYLCFLLEFLLGFNFIYYHIQIL